MAGVPLREQLRGALSTIEQLRAENDVLRAENELLGDRVSRMEAQLKAASTTGKPVGCNRAIY